MSTRKSVNLRSGQTSSLPFNVERNFVMLDTVGLEPFVKLDKDLKKAATTLTPNEARYLVDAYYQVQGYRIRFGNQIRALSESGEPHDLIRWMLTNAEGLENNIQRALDSYSKSN